MGQAAGPVLAIDVETYPRCAGSIEILAFVTEPRSRGRLLAIKIFAFVTEPRSRGPCSRTPASTDIPSIASARGPPRFAWVFEPA